MKITIGKVAELMNIHPQTLRLLIKQQKVDFAIFYKTKDDNTRGAYIFNTPKLAKYLGLTHDELEEALK